jgi:TRAP-type transport system periplasmic protein
VYRSTLPVTDHNTASKTRTAEAGENDTMGFALSRRSALAAAALAMPAIISHRAGAAAVVTLRVAAASPPNKFGGHYLWFKPFQEALQNAAGDKIRLDYFPNGQLGKEADVVEQVKVGPVDIMITGSSIWATVVPEVGMLDLGFLFDGYDHCARAMDSGIGATLADLMHQRTGVSVLGWGFQVGARSVYTKQQATSLADLHDVKLRVLPTAAFIETFKMMGAIPTPIPVNELYTALQTGVVDGFEHDPGTANSYKFYEVTKNCLLTRHLYSPMLVAIGKRGLAKISPELMPVFLKAAQESTAKDRADVPGVEAEAMTLLQQHGVVFSPLPAADRLQIKAEMSQHLYKDFAQRYPATAPLFELAAKATA